MHVSQTVCNSKTSGRIMKEIEIWDSYVGCLVICRSFCALVAMWPTFQKVCRREKRIEIWDTVTTVTHLLSSAGLVVSKVSLRSFVALVSKRSVNG